MITNKLLVLLAISCMILQTCAMDYNRHLPKINRELVELDSDTPQQKYIHNLYGLASLLAIQHLELSKLSNKIENCETILTKLAASLSNKIEEALENVLPFPQELRIFLNLHLILHMILTPWKISFKTSIFI